MKTVAVLYVDPRGVYPTLPGVECWGEARDARFYPGPHPVVAHPPYGPWGKLRHLCTRQDPICAHRALEDVQTWGGVLEHPEHSQLWNYYELPAPGDVADHYGGRTYVVDQCDWGHCCRKRTWLYVVGVDHQWVMRKLRARSESGTPTHCVSRDAKRKSSLLTRCSRAAATRTPRQFAEFLVALARKC
jgi:hypothetical protein